MNSVESDEIWCRHVTALFAAPARTNDTEDTEDYFPQCLLTHLLSQNHRSVSQSTTPRPDEARCRQIVSARDEAFWATRIAKSTREANAIDAVLSRSALKHSSIEEKAMQSAKEIQEMIEYVRGQNKVIEEATRQLQESKRLSATLH